MKKVVITILFFFQTTFLYASDQEKKLNLLFNELKSDISTKSSEIEEKIWTLWSTHPTNKNLTLMLDKGTKLVQNQNLNKAIMVFTEVIKIDPSWAEAWNKRATVYYMIGEYKKSQKDIDKVLELEERHFGALAGQGLVNIQLKNYEKAIKSYKKAKDIYPSMQSAEIMIKKIEDLIKEQTI